MSDHLLGKSCLLGLRYVIIELVPDCQIIFYLFFTFNVKRTFRFVFICLQM